MKNINLSELLAIDRTILANERTILAYIRTSLSLIVAGISFLKLFSENSLKILGAIFIVVGIVTIFFGIRRYLKYHKELNEIRKRGEI
ncbi:MAG: putative rane protein [Fusobacteriaceae bacterium]|jgi:putative membrane protein|nr:hypothetical protein [Fusobacteriales bacterium]MDN5303655.1 putative rane protein [Fusobacteriaceae bacterium]